MQHLRYNATGYHCHFSLLILLFSRLTTEWEGVRSARGCYICCCSCSGETLHWLGQLAGLHLDQAWGSTCEGSCGGGHNSSPAVRGRRRTQRKSEAEAGEVELHRERVRRLTSNSLCFFFVISATSSSASRSGKYWTHVKRNMSFCAFNGSNTTKSLIDDRNSGNLRHGWEEPAQHWSCYLMARKELTWSHTGLFRVTLVVHG